MLMFDGLVNRRPYRKISHTKVQVQYITVSTYILIVLPINTMVQAYCKVLYMYNVKE